MTTPPVPGRMLGSIPLDILETGLNLADGQRIVRMDLQFDPPALLLVIEGPDLPVPGRGEASQMMAVAQAHVQAIERDILFVGTDERLAAILNVTNGDAS